ncbi:hypothetical protein DPMN_135561 [Dreissena polymorpha]|uniref:Uncharacterized protein n=1 Tax=Dreissena polymorpha TaxID=45954 RepID=A0A9D4FZE9_DREPO|nr:hypothetical protein DPMN_135561 [Dreissena polymorpha]
MTETNKQEELKVTLSVNKFQVPQELLDEETLWIVKEALASTSGMFGKPKTPVMNKNEEVIADDEGRRCCAPTEAESITAETLKADVNTSVELLYPLLRMICEKKRNAYIVERGLPLKAHKGRQPQAVNQISRDNTGSLRLRWNKSKTDPVEKLEAVEGEVDLSMIWLFHLTPNNRCKQSPIVGDNSTRLGGTIKRGESSALNTNAFNNTPIIAHDDAVEEAENCTSIGSILDNHGRSELASRDRHHHQYQAYLYHLLRRDLDNLPTSPSDTQVLHQPMPHVDSQDLPASKGQQQRIMEKTKAEFSHLKRKTDGQDVGTTREIFTEPKHLEDAGLRSHRGG